MPSLCETCRHMREVLTARSRFLLCELSTTNAAFAKYPPQPVVHCAGHEPRGARLVLLPGTFAVCRLDAGAAIPSWSTTGVFFSVTQTADELSIVCDQACVPAGVRSERDCRCLQLLGPIPFTAVGVLAALVEPLAAAGVSVFAVSTFDTDYVLVKDADVAKACAALRQAGHEVNQTP